MKFKAGDRVMVVASWFESNSIPPPIGSVGEITVGMDCDGDYEVSIPDWPCLKYDPDWFIPHWALVKIDDRPEAGSWDEICALTRGWRPGVVTCG